MDNIYFSFKNILVFIFLQSLNDLLLMVYYLLTAASTYYFIITLGKSEQLIRKEIFQTHFFKVKHVIDWTVF